MPDDSIVVRPPEFEKVLEELHVVRLGGHLKSEMQARRDLEDVYHRLLEDVTALEAAVEKGRADVAQAEETARRAVAGEARAHADQALLQSRHTRIKIICCALAAAAVGLVIVAWDDLSALTLDLLSRFVA